MLADFTVKGLIRRTMDQERKSIVGSTNVVLILMNVYNFLVVCADCQILQVC